MERKAKKGLRAQDIYNDKRPLSWSALSSFAYSRERWFETYVLGIKQTSIELSFGNDVDKRLQSDPTFLPEVERYPIIQHAMKAQVADIPLVGYADGFDPHTLRLKDDKTGKKEWTQERADETGQLTMYALLLYLTEKIKPEDVKLYISWLPTVEVKEKGMLKRKENGLITFRDDPVVPVVFETRRTMKDILLFGGLIQSTFKEIDEYLASDPQISQ